LGGNWALTALSILLLSSSLPWQLWCSKVTDWWSDLMRAIIKHLPKHQLRWIRMSFALCSTPPIVGWPIICNVWYEHILDTLLMPAFQFLVEMGYLIDICACLPKFCSPLPMFFCSIPLSAPGGTNYQLLEDA
jgi:hypothetical protein